MVKRLMFEKPLGMRDTLPFFYKQKSKARKNLSDAISSYGYSFMDTPIMEYHETVGKVSATLDQQLFKLLDQQGHTLVLRPDMTSPIARVAASQLKNSEFPLRLAYEGPVFRAQQTEGGKPAQFEQVGTELIGDHSSYGDAEVIALLVESLQKTGLDDFVITVGHIGYVKAFFTDLLGDDEETIDTLLNNLYRKNYVGYREAVKEVPVQKDKKDALLQLLSLKGGEEIFESSRSLARNQACMQAVNELKQLYRLLQEYEVERYIHFDLNLISHMDYYTGILFEGYAPNLGALLCNGGRYDTLLPSFQLSASATGFAVHLERLLEALNEQETKDERIGVIVDDDTYNKGVVESKRYRREGLCVLLQHVDQIPDIKAFKAELSRTIDLTKDGGEFDE
ncbi:ATP phosphoribosyltransferase regulatory subunit [Halobacillus karajensis]|uniref:ATP phosphoribosyltransferase regulatory subunit n=1 Tax=Halobacillus karajensis TaxID=195088 RepID=A0A059NWF5_9BACI|nr:ATP phosphoribosyltransferase regulatory subunit [Halobacillus karajensis]CDQ19253.1 ATP phosphoribosyltransferase regulatory subunit [Halobacillus karajensis]CDQ22673.1 ATP phosphoribosyltransferase regulatory subunit [Halobacillus karajensis]CDQ26155.1 ATP phosphoribosyltransferase regulatory subunit [Halobacillus karajensis]SEH39361.1 ATP phosphoribosyltransferase regulatory subunit [Halobacillus karajensis]